MEGRTLAYEGVGARHERHADRRTTLATQEPAAASRFFEDSPLSLIEWDGEFRVRRWSRQAERLFGWKESEVRGKTFEDFPFVHPDDLGRVRDGAERLGRSDEAHTLRRNRNLHRDGRTLQCEWHNSVLRDAEGRIRSVLSLVRDVGERDQARAQLDAEQQRSERALTAAGAGRWEWDHVTGLRTSDARCAELLELVPQGVLRLDLEELESRVHPQDLGKLRAHHRAYAEGLFPVLSVTFRLRGHDGRWRWFLDRGRVAEQDAYGRPRRSTGFLAEIDGLDGRPWDGSPSGAAEAERARLRSGVVQQFNNVLAAIRGHAELARVEQSAGRAGSEHIEEIVRAAARAAALMSQFQAFGPQDTIRLRPVELLPQVETACELAASLHGVRPQFLVQPGVEGGRVLADQGMLLRGLVRLLTGLVGAAFRGTGGGRLELDATACTLPRAEDLPPGHGNCLRLLLTPPAGTFDASDLGELVDGSVDGSGPSDGLRHLFEAHGGALQVRSTPERGPHLQVLLPRYAPTAPEAAPEAGPERPAARADEPGVVGRGDVLVVDDEVVLAELYGRILRRAGYSVRVCTSPDEALRCCEGGVRFELVVTDRAMPGLDGVQLATALRARDPELMVVLVSGDGRTELAPEEVGVIDCILPKPFGVDELGAAAAALLEARRRRVRAQDADPARESASASRCALSDGARPPA